MIDSPTTPETELRMLPLVLETCDGESITIRGGPALILVYRGHW
jgi:hypothetical protein